jgi:hypothetical protein
MTDMNTFETTVATLFEAFYDRRYTPYIAYHEEGYLITHDGDTPVIVTQVEIDAEGAAAVASRIIKAWEA